MPELYVLINGQHRSSRRLASFAPHKLRDSWRRACLCVLCGSAGLCSIVWGHRSGFAQSPIKEHVGYPQFTSSAVVNILVRLLCLCPVVGLLARQSFSFSGHHRFPKWQC